MILFSLPATTMVSVYQRRLGAGSPYTMQEITAYRVEFLNINILATILIAKRVVQQVVSTLTKTETVHSKQYRWNNSYLWIVEKYEFRNTLTTFQSLA